MRPKVFESEAYRVWTGTLGTPLHGIEDAEQHELDFIPFKLQIWLKTQRDCDKDHATQQGLYLLQSPTFGYHSTHVQPHQSLFLPADALSCFSIYSPSPFVSTVLVVVDVTDTLQQGHFFGRVRQLALGLDTQSNLLGSDQDNGALFETETVAELLAALNTAFPSVHLSITANRCLAKRKMSCRAVNETVGTLVKRRKTLSPKAFYGATSASSLHPISFTDTTWQSFYEKLHFRVSQSLMCQLEGTAPLSSSFPRQHEAFEFADHVAAFRRRVKAPCNASTEYSMEDPPRIFSFENAHDGKRRYLVATFAEFWKKYTTTRDDQRHVYEIIRDGVPCRLYFDLEFKRAINVHVNGNALVTRLVSLLQLQLYRSYRLCVRRQEIYELDSSTPDKFSRHLILHFPDGSLFTNNLHAGAFVREFIRDLAAVNSNALGGSSDRLSPFLVNTESADDSVDKQQLFIDTSVYTRNRMFRVLGSSKFRKHTVLRALSPPAGPELDRNLFENTLVCPFPSRESMKLHRKTKNGRLFQCQSGLTARGRSRNVITIAKSLSASSMGCQRSMYPELDAFIRSQATTGGVQGEIRAIQLLMTRPAKIPGQDNDQEQAVENPFQAYMVIYHMARNRWCANIERAHTSNNVMFLVDLSQRVFYQKCHDPTCQAMDFRSPPQALPQHITFCTKKG